MQNGLVLVSTMNQLRVSGKKRDDLQAVITLLKDSKTDLPLQYENFRD